MTGRRLKQVTVLDALHNLGPRTRDALALHFGVPPATVQTHLVALRDRGEIYASAWAEPDGPGQWSPVWAVQTRPASPNAPRPQSHRHSAPLRSLEELEEQTVVRGEGVKNEHALMARALPTITVGGETVDVGIFGGLVRASSKPMRVSVSTGRPRGRPRATATAATR